MQRGFGRELLQGRRERAPNLFLIDVQKGQLAQVSRLTREVSGAPPEAAPLIRARLTQVGSEPVTLKDLRGLTLEERSRQRFLTREYNLTYKDVLHEGEKVAQGRFWLPGETTPQVSVERSFAERLGLTLGTRLTFDIQGRSVEAPVTSIRTIEWMAMRPNFFVVFPEAVLKPAPQVFIGSFSLHDAAKVASYQRELLRRFPNVSVIDAGKALERVSGLLGMLIDALRVLAWFCVAVGLLVMAGTLSLGREERQERHGVLRALAQDAHRLLAGPGRPGPDFGGGLAARGGGVAVFFSLPAVDWSSRGFDR